MNLKLKPAAYAAITAVSVALFLGNIFYFSMYENEKDVNQYRQVQINSLNTDKEELLKETRKLSVELERRIAQYSELFNSFNTKEKQLKEQNRRIEKLSAESNSAKALEKDLRVLKEIKASLEKEMFELNNKLYLVQQENLKLKKENLFLTENLQILSEQNNLLTLKIGQASSIKAENIIAHAEKKVKTRFVKVRKGKKADRLAISFDMAENPLAQHGSKQIYFRIMDPENNVIKGPKAGSFARKEDQILTEFSGVKEVEYTGQKQKVYFFIDKKGLEKGRYSVQIFSDEDFSGSALFVIN